MVIRKESFVMNSNPSGSIKGKSLVKKIGDTNEQGVKAGFGLLRMFSVYGGRSPGVLTAGRGAGIVDQPSQPPVINKIDRRNP
jgi:hypothetical protein